MNRDQKSQIIAELAEKFTKYNNVYFADVAGLDGVSNNELRRQFHKSGIKIQVAKNTLIKRAIAESGRNFGALSDDLKGSTTVIFTEDIKAPAQVIKDFRKGGKEFPVLKGAFIDNDIFVGDDQLDTLLKLKTKNELIGEIIGLLQSPAQNVISGLQSSGGKLAGIVKTLSERPE